MTQARRQGWIRNIYARFYGNNFEVSGVRANIFLGFMEVILRLQEGGRILFEVGRSSVPIRDFSMEFPLHIWKGTPWQFQNTEIEKEDLISWLYALYSQTALRAQTTKYSTVHFVFGTSHSKWEGKWHVVNCPTQPTCFAHFDLCICQLCFINPKKEIWKKTQQGN